MIGKILRPTLWMLDRMVRTHRAVVLGLILVLSVGGQWVYNNLISERLALLASEQAVTVIAAMLPMGLYLVFWSALLGVGDVMHQLYQASDLELLMVAPIPYRTIFVVKLLQGSRATLIPAAGLGAGLLALGLARRASPVYYPLILLLILAAMALTTALVMALVIVLARVLPAQKVRSWMPVAIVLASVGLILFQQSAAAWFAEQTTWIAFLTTALLDPGQLALLATGLVGLAVGTSLAAYGIFDKSFHEGWNRFREVPRRREPVATDTRRRTDISPIVRWLPVQLRAIVVKEWLELRRDPRALLNLAQPLILAIVTVLIPALGGGQASTTLRPLLFWFMFVLLGMFLSFLPLGTALTAVAQEGPNIALLRTTPISMSDVLKAKLWATWLPTVSAWVLVLLAAALWLRVFPWQMGILVALAVWASAGASVATVAIGGLSVDFGVEELRRRVPTLVTYVTIGLNLAFVLLTAAAFAWLAVRQFPDSPALLPVRALAGFRPVGWLFSDSLWSPSILMAGQVAFWVVSRILWDAAVRRLERWEAT